MNDDVKYKIGSIYFAIFGIVVTSFGAIGLMLGLAGKSLTWGIMEMSGEFLLWRGLILWFAGLFYLSSTKNFADIHEQAKAVMASVMIWLIAGIEIFGMILESIPGGEEGGWFNTLEGFFETYAPPYIPSLFLLPFSLVIVYYIKLLKRRES